MTKSQVFFWLLVSFIAGVAAASFVPISPTLVWAFFVFGGAVAVFGILRSGQRQHVIVAAGAAIALAMGMFWFLHKNRAALPFEHRVGGRFQMEGIVADEPVRRSKIQQLIVREFETGVKVFITVRPYPEYRYGDHLKISGRLERPENFSRDFDYVAYLAKDDIFYTMAYPEMAILERDQGSLIYRLLFRLKAAFADRLNSHFPEPHAAFLSGLILGERRSLPSALVAELQQTGTSHIVALSGYNITIVADALLKTLMFFFIPFAWAFWLAAAGILGFVMLTGAAASVVRAAIMGLLVLVARREGRWYGMRNAMAFAAAVMIFHNPQVLRFDTAFQLSFMATLGLLYGAPLVEHWYDALKLRFIPPARRAHLIRERRESLARPPARSFLRETLVATLAAQLFVLPLLVYQFGTLSLISPLANVAVIPLIPATMFFGFLTGGLAFVWGELGWISAGPAWALLHYELSAIHALATLPFAALEVRGLGLAALLGGYAIIGYWLWRFRSRQDKRYGETLRQTP